MVCGEHVGSFESLRDGLPVGEDGQILTLTSRDALPDLDVDGPGLVDDLVLLADGKTNVEGPDMDIDCRRTSPTIRGSPIEVTVMLTRLVMSPRSSTA
ncbi:hypothetical protein [Nesterenkonia pannonica]|uniref:hypothetical protein n=1 Tax=Nesterenkonia pannonica TaxID=1548602 RepID=UPI002164D21A|nr:hypothetical protein [Nesterenkonia pannonica]